VIRIILLVDIDDSTKLTDWRRQIEAEAPPGYTVTKLSCSGWGRNFENGAVHLDVSLRIESPPDILPRIKIR